MISNTRGARAVHDSELSCVESESEQLGVLRSKMVKFAKMQRGGAQLAEVAVQEALLGAFMSRATYAGKASLKTWVVSFLKNMIADIRRQRQRHPQASKRVVAGENAQESDLFELFHGRGMWEPDERPANWGSSPEELADKQIWRVFEMCLDELSGQQDRAFMMYEYIGLDAKEICAERGVTSANLNVMLHRARLRLRECLENNCFSNGGASC